MLHVPRIRKDLFLAQQFDHAGSEILIKFGNYFLKNSHAHGQENTQT